MATFNLKNFVFTIAVEGGPLNFLGICVAPIEECRVIFVGDTELTT